VEEREKEEKKKKRVDRITTTFISHLLLLLLVSPIVQLANESMASACVMNNNEPNSVLRYGMMSAALARLIPYPQW
jgi:hypothetical protein